MVNKLDSLIGKIVIFPYGSSYKGTRVVNETNKKFEYDSFKHVTEGFKPKPCILMKNIIIHITEDEEEAIEILNNLNSLTDQLKKLKVEIRDTHNGLREKAGL